MGWLCFILCEHMHNVLDKTEVMEYAYYILKL